MIKEYVFNTGVRPFDFDPPAGMAFMKGFRNSGNGVYGIPFECEEVPNGYIPTICCDTKEYPNTNDNLVREIKLGSALKGKYVYFKQDQKSQIIQLK